MNTTIIRRLIGAGSALVIAGCGSATANSAGSTNPRSPSTQTPTSNATVASATVSGHGAVLVGGSNGMTLYQFALDTANSGQTACTGGCFTTWPPLTVAAGVTPTAASGLTGQWGTITRQDGHGIQVTYNGKPLYFYSGDTKPGDANGNYPHWSSVSAASGGGGAAPTATPAGNGSSPSNPYGY